jgi:hypothetical protein
VRRSIAAWGGSTPDDTGCTNPGRFSVSPLTSSFHRIPSVIDRMRGASYWHLPSFAQSAPSLAARRDLPAPHRFCLTAHTRPHPAARAWLRLQSAPIASPVFQSTPSVLTGSIDGISPSGGSVLPRSIDGTPCPTSGSRAHFGSIAEKNQFFLIFTEKSRFTCLKHGRSRHYHSRALPSFRH